MAQGLVLRAGVINYSGCLEDSTIGDLEQALALTEDLPAQGRMLLCIFLGLALAYLRVEDCDKAEAQLIKAEEHKRALSEDPVLVTQIQWIRGLIAFEKGDFKLAEEELSSAREQSERLDETSNSLMLTLDIARLWLERGELPKAIELATEALTLLESLNFGPEIVKTLRIFRKAVEIGQIDQAFLERVGRIDIQLNASPELIRWRRP